MNEFLDDMNGNPSELSQEIRNLRDLEKLERQWEEFEISMATGYFGRTLSKTEVAEILGTEGLGESERLQPNFIEAINSLPTTAPLSGLISFVKSGDGVLKTAYRNVERAYNRKMSLREALEDEAGIFREHFSDDQWKAIRRSIDNLDLGSFLSVLAAGMRQASARLWFSPLGLYHRRYGETWEWQTAAPT